MEELVTLDQAKANMKLSGTAEDDDLQLLLTLAHAIVIDRVKDRVSGAAEWAAEVEAWTDESTDLRVQLVIAAILDQFGAMYRHRGDDEASAHSAFDDGGMSHKAAGLVKRLRDPALA